MFELNAVAQPFAVRVSHGKNLSPLSTPAQDSFEAMREAILIHMGQVLPAQLASTGARIFIRSHHGDITGEGTAIVG